MIGEIIGHYKIIEKLGAGGMGVVYLAEDNRLDRKVAIKFLPTQLQENEEEKQRFIQEAKTASSLDHPNICTIYEIDETDEDQTYIVMAYYGDVSLKKLLKQGPLPSSKAVDFAIQIANGMARAHDAGIVHRDIKPANVMITEHGEVKIVDFGLAKVANLNLTRSGTTLGTAAYMSPEQARGSEVDRRSDIWSMGAVFYEMLSGIRPFKGEYEQAVLYSVLNTEPEPLSGIDPDYEDRLKEIFSKTLNKNADERFQLAADVSAHLKPLKDAQTLVVSEVKPVPVPVSQGKVDSSHLTLTIKKPAITKRSVFGLLGVAAVAVLIIVFLIPMFQSGDRQGSIAILPFVISGGEGDIDFLSEGIPDYMVSSLQRIPDLRVIPFTSVLHQYGKELQDPVKVGEELNVGIVVTGRISQFGDDINIAIELVDTKTNTVLFLLNFSEKRSNVANIPTLIAQSITEKLDVQITGEVAEQAFKIDTTDPEAVQNYMIGRSFSRKRTPDDLATGIDYFNRAIAIDPNFALAYSGLADSYGLQNQYAGIPRHIAFPKQRAAAERALELDENSAEAHASMGFTLRNEYRYKESIDVFNRAIELNPNYTQAHHWLALSYRAAYQLDKAIETGEKALEIDPISPIIMGNLALAYGPGMGMADKAFELLERTIELNPDDGSAYARYGNALSQFGENEKALEFAIKGFELEPNGFLVNLDMGYVYNRAGQTDEAIGQFNDIIERYPGYAVPHTQLGIIYRVKEEYETAIEFHKKAVELDPLSAAEHNSYGLTLRNSGDLDGAAAEIVRAIAINPINRTYSNNLGGVYLRYGDHDKALETYLKAFANDPENANTASNIGSIYNDLRDYEEAERYHNMAISIDPSQSLFYQRKIDTYLNRDGSTVEAWKILNEAEDHFEPSELAIFASNLNMMDGDYQLAIDRVEQIKDTPGYFITNGVANGLLGKKQSSLQIWGELKDTWEPLSRGLPNEAGIRMLVGFGYAGLGMKEEAMREAEKALELSTVGSNGYTDTDILLPVSVIYTIAGEHDMAIDILEQLLSQASNTSAARLKIDPLFIPLWDNPRFQTLVGGR